MAAVFGQYDLVGRLDALVAPAPEVLLSDALDSDSVAQEKEWMPFAGEENLSAFMSNLIVVLATLVQA